jgi:hypothetical protein
VLGAVIVEFTPEGEVEERISLLDLLDPTRIGRDSTSTGWPTRYVAAGEVAHDWDHANAVIYEAASDSYYLSLRNQDAILKVHRGSETLTWILGTPANWASPWSDKLLTPVGDLLWPFHQHAVELTPAGLGLYDNGNYRAAAYEPPGDEYSRAVVYSIDEEARTVSEVWSYGAASGADHFFSGAMGDADWQPNTGNVLIVNAVVDGNSAEILEVTPAGERVFELHLADDSGTIFTIYRAQRLADIRR